MDNSGYPVDNLWITFLVAYFLGICTKIQKISVQKFFFPFMPLARRFTMGTQIAIERKDLEKAGWEFVMVIRKGDYEFVSYCEDCFFADCNAWGNNRALFKEAGLLDLPHILT